MCYLLALSQALWDKTRMSQSQDIFRPLSFDKIIYNESQDHRFQFFKWSTSPIPFCIPRAKDIGLFSKCNLGSNLHGTSEIVVDYESTLNVCGLLYHGNNKFRTSRPFFKVSCIWKIVIAISVIIAIHIEAICNQRRARQNTVNGNCYQPRGRVITIK